MRNLTIAAGIAAVLGASSAFALAPGTATTVNLNVAGSSAFRDAFLTELSTGGYCVAGTLNLYRANAGDAPDLRAYTCLTANAAPVPTSARNQNATFYYRSEGGSIMGVGPLVKNIVLTRLNVTAAGCGTAVAPPAFTTCTATLNTATDVGTGAVAQSKVFLGVSDVEPPALTGENWGTAFTFLGADPGAAAVSSAINATSAIGQVFSIVVSNAGPTAGVTDLRKQDVTSIFAGNYADWSEVQNAAGTGTLAPGPITVCRRDTGSGTQASASIYFNGKNCSSASYTFVTPPNGPNGNPVIISTTTGGVKTCITNAAAAGNGAIGIVAVGNTPTNGTTVSLDGVAATNTNAALGRYQYYVESTLNTPLKYTVPAPEAALGAVFISRLQLNATAPAGASLISLPVGSNAPSVPLTVSASGVPVALGSKGGNNCLLPQNQN